jgi:hypothetical protein
MTSRQSGQWKNSSTLTQTSVIEMAGWSVPLRGTFTPGKDTQYALYGGLGGPWGGCVISLEHLAPIRFEDLDCTDCSESLYRPLSHQPPLGVM